MRLYDHRNEILNFLSTFVVFEVLGKFVLLGVLWTFRYFGMPQLYFLYYTFPNHGMWFFMTMLLLATMVSIIRIIKKRRF